ncbi:MAG TPA: alpha/beta fold hydrolase [Candidatus Baltobacteraceae bacterium]|nr:alpha/beta fold hydrolase [Candidatus Baltobacteraceae bacterium]
MRRIFAFMAVLSVTACSSSTITTIPRQEPLASFDATAPRGKIERLFYVTTISKARMSAGLFGKVISELGGPPKCAVKLFGIKYETVGVNSEPANASAAFFVPQAPCKAPFPLVGYAHGTNPVQEQLITSPKTASAAWTAPDQDPIVVAAIFAAHGYAVAATDYLGLGLSTYSYHPYLHAASEASAVVDSMRAARNAAAKLHVSLSKKVFLSGHSQGGQSAVATQRAIEAQYRGEFDLLGDAPSSGPYALSQTFQDSLRHQSQDAPILAAYILPGYQKIYGNIYTDSTQIFKSPYASRVDTLLPVATYRDEKKLYGKTLPLQLAQLLQPSFVSSFLNDPSSPARKDTADNDLLSKWIPKAPVYLCGGRRDPEVEFKNAKKAYAYFHAHGVNVTLVDVNALIPSYVPMSDYHVVVALFCLPLARSQFFDALK